MFKKIPHKFVLFLSVLLVAVPLSLAGALAASGTASPEPGLSLGMSAPSKVLYGADETVTLTAQDAVGAGYGYNLTFEATLPKGVNCATDCTADGVTPTSTTNSSTGVTTLVWSNVSDLSPGQTLTLSFDVLPSSSSFAVGDNVSISAGAAVADAGDIRFIPTYSSTSGAWTDADSHASNSASSALTALEVAPTGGGDEGAILRGVHDHQAVYSLTVSNNLVNATDGATLDVDLPADLEYLGCSTFSDNTTDAPSNVSGTNPAQEYPGAGAITPQGGLSTPNCPAPASVGTVQGTAAPTGATTALWNGANGFITEDNAGITEPGDSSAEQNVYTDTQFSLGNLTAGQTVTLEFIAAVPLLDNTTNWTTSGGAPTAGSGKQAANLDNNGGADTYDGEPTDLYALAAGDYDGTTMSYDDTLDTGVAKDMVVHKSVLSNDAGSNTALESGQHVEWQLAVSTDEYNYSNSPEGDSNGVVVTDTVPSGLCPLTANTSSSLLSGSAAAECDGVAGDAPSSTYASEQENSDGTSTLTWDSSTDSALATISPDSTVDIDYWTVTLSHYQSGDAPTTPVLANDTVTNGVSASSTANLICAPPGQSDQDCTGATTQIDQGAGALVNNLTEQSQSSDSATLTSTGPTLDKTVSSNTSATNATNGDSTTGTDPQNYGSTEPTYHPGDKVWFNVHEDFPNALQTNNPDVYDYLPNTLTYVTSSEQADSTQSGWASPDRPEDAGNFTDLASGTAGSSNTPGDTLQWSVPEGTSDVASSAVFDADLAATVDWPNPQVQMPAGAYSNYIVGNLAKTDSVNTDEDSFSLRSLQNIQVSAPDLTLSESADDTGGTLPGSAPTSGKTVNVVNGTQVTETVTVSNGGTDAAATAFVVDQLPTGITCADVSSESYTPNGDGTAATGACDNTTGYVTWNVESLPASDSVNLTYVVTLPENQASPGAFFTTDAYVTQYTSTTNTGGSFTYNAPCGSVPSSLDCDNADANVPEANDSNTWNVPGATVTETDNTPTTLGTDDGNPPTGTSGKATIGDTILYTVTTTIPANTELASNGEIGDVGLPAGVEYVNDSTAVLSVAGDSGDPETDFTASDPSTGPGVTIVAGYHSTVETVVTETFEVWVKNVAANTAGASIASDENELSWTDGGGTAQSVNESASNTKVTVEEAELSQTLTDNQSGAAVDGTTPIQYTATVTNNGGSTAYNTAETVTVPSTLGDICTITSPSTSCTTTDGGGNTGTWTPADPADANPTGGTITWPALAGLSAGDSLSYVFSASVISTPAGGTSLQMTAEAQGQSTDSATDSAANDGSNTRTTGNDPNNLTEPSPYYDALAHDSVPVAQPSVAESSSLDVANTDLQGTGSDPYAGDITTGQPVTYTLTVTIPSNVTTYNDTIEQTLPADMKFTGYATASCASTCAGAPLTILAYNQQTNGDGSTTIAWSVADNGQSPDDGNVAAVSGTRTVTLTYTAYPLNSAAAGDTETDGAFFYDNASDDGTAFNAGTIPATSAFAYASSKVDDPLTVVAPQVDLSQTIGVNGGTLSAGPDAFQDGDTIDYEITVKNTGTSPLYDATVDDTVPAELSVQSITDSSDFSGNWNPGDNTLAWVLHDADGIAPGASVTLDYTANVANIANDSEGDAIDSAASVASAYGLPCAPGSTGDCANPFATYTSPSPDAAATVEADLHVPQLQTVTSTPGGSAAEVGTAFTWEVTITNTSGSATASDISVADTLPHNWQYVPGTASFSNGTTSSGIEPDAPATGTSLTWTNTGISLAPGAVETLTFEATPSVAAATDPGTGASNPNTDTASSSTLDQAGASGDNDGPYASSTSSANAQLSAPTLTVAVTPDGGTGTAGGEVDWTVTVTNGGTSTDHNVVIDDTLPSGYTYAARSAMASPSTGFSETSASGSDIEWALSQLGAGDSVTITVPSTSDPTAASGTVSTDQATVSSDDTSGSESDTGTVTLSNEYDLEATDSAAATAVAGNDLTYTIGVTNVAGPSEATGVQIRDPLPAGTTFVSAPGCTAAAGSVICAVGTLAPGASSNYSVTVQIDPADTAPLTDTDTVSATPSYDTDVSDDTATADTTLSSEADVAVTDTVAAPVLHDGNAVYTLVVTNDGPSTATGVALTDQLDPSLTYVSNDGGCPAPSSGLLTCSIGTLAPGASTTIHVTATAPAVGPIANDAAVTATTTDPNAANNSDSAPANVAEAADLTVTGSAPATTQVGDQLTYSFDAKNAGPDTAQSAVATVTLPPGVAFVSGPAGCTASGSVVTCDLGDIAVGGDADFDITVTVPSGAEASTLLASATVTSATAVPASDTATTSAQSQVAPTADLGVSVSAPGQATAPGQISWTVEVTNNGPSDDTGVVLTDTAPAGVTSISASGQQGSCSVSGATVTCAIGALASGAGTTVTITGQLPAAAVGSTITDSAAVSGDVQDLVSSNDTATAPTTVVAAPPVTTSTSTTPATTTPTTPTPTTTTKKTSTKKTSTKKTSGPKLEVSVTPAKPPVLGAVTPYVITVKNSGGSPAKQVVISDSFAGAGKVVSASIPGGKCTVSDGTSVRCTVSGLAARGSLHAHVDIKIGTTAKFSNVASATAAGIKSNGKASGAAQSAQAKVVSPVALPKARLKTSVRVSSARVRAGKSFTETLGVSNVSNGTAADVTVCQPLGGAFVMRRLAPGGVLTHGQLCFKVPSLGAHATKQWTVTLQPARTSAHTLPAQAHAAAKNAPKVSAATSVTVVPTVQHVSELTG